MRFIVANERRVDEQGQGSLALANSGHVPKSDRQGLFDLFEDKAAP